MIHAYDKVYLERARSTLACALDYGCADQGCDLEDFFAAFISTGIAARFESGEASIVAGMSGIELACLVFEQAHIPFDYAASNKTPSARIAGRSPKYWCGWALAYYQWETALSFKQIAQFAPFKLVERLYHPYHEMDIRHFVEKLNELRRTALPDTNLKHLRQRTELSQRQLAELSGVPLRTIQQYEQRQKNINKAQAVYVFALAQTMHCNPASLLEYEMDA